MTVAQENKINSIIGDVDYIKSQLTKFDETCNSFETLKIAVYEQTDSIVKELNELKKELSDG